MEGGGELLHGEVDKAQVVKDLPVKRGEVAGLLFSHVVIFQNGNFCT